MKKILLLTLLLLPSCIPYPHSVRTFPEISGVFLENGIPKKGIVVGYNDSKNEDACIPSESKLTTDDKGEFNIPAEYRNKTFATIGMVHILNRWKLCFQDEKGRKFIWEDNEYGPEDAPERLFITCEATNKDICSYVNK